MIINNRAILNQIPSSTNANNTVASVLGNSAWQFIITFFGSAALGVLSALFSAVVSIIIMLLLFSAVVSIIIMLLLFVYLFCL